MSQKTIVYEAIKSIISFNDGDKVSLTEDQKNKVCDIITKTIIETKSMTAEGLVKYNTPEKMRNKSVPGLLNNWLNKDTRLNGGKKHIPKNPGSRPSDPQLKEMSKLLDQFKAQNAHEQIAILEQAIDDRKKQLMIEKAKTIKIDLSIIPDDLLSKLNIDEEQQG